MRHIIDRPNVHVHLVSDLRPRKGALTAAQQIESMIARQGWVVGNIIGSEQALRAQFGLGHRVGREAIRVLQSRNAIRARRGSQGGLLIGSPSRLMAIDAIADYFDAIAVDTCELIEAQTVLAGMAKAYVAMTAIRTGEIFLAALAEAQRRRTVIGPQAAPAHTGYADAQGAPLVKVRGDRVSQVAHNLLIEIERLRHANQPLWLGTEQALCELHNVGRAVLRQTLRILEARGIVESHRGRFGGIKAIVPSVRGAIETTLSYLSTASLHQSDLLPWTNALGNSLNTLALERWSDTAQNRFKALQDTSNPAHADWELRLTNVQWDACGNRVLAFVARCVATYQIRFLPEGHYVTQRDRWAYQEALLEGAYAMSRQDRQGVRDACSSQSIVLERMLEPFVDRPAPRRPARESM